MFSFFLILVFIYCCYVGYRRGLIYEGMMAAGYLVSFIIASLLYRPIGNFLSMWVPYPSASDKSTFAFFDQTTGLTLDKSFYAAVGFTAILLVCFLIWRLVMVGFDNIQYADVTPAINIWGSVLVALIVTAITLCLLLFILATIPSDPLQSALGHSLLANSILRYSPGISSLFTHLFITSV
ncbi:putative membrane protein required for colicin V production [Lactobacillus colini]|uniref:Membrane protein required for colicin V production n=1 Tax=Lactobacillus colini TaxID=1819254 RepID=A0ABS4MG48_9LACO|nr:CvpA family protein [Lactobacillus colini]MBP2058573.1 putative membrane protein required for colicin V production [Lactobacillus colini]